MRSVPVSGLFGIPTLYTTYNRAVQYLPNARFTIGYVLVEPKSEADIPEIKNAVAKLGYLGLTEQEFEEKIANFYIYQTGVGTNILLMTFIGFLVGLSISGQTFYTFVLENLEKFGALKAIGASNSELVYMILFQASFTSIIGYGLGVGISAPLIAVGKKFVPNYTADYRLLEPRAGVRHGACNCRLLEPSGGQKSHEGPTLRYLQRLTWPRRQ